jgi:D-alanyl-D-alanine carboxypeptidase/D-alanyl-D-alanine-endopeptidase (penicillin-binding protein 4)
MTHDPKGAPRRRQVVPLAAALTALAIVTAACSGSSDASSLGETGNAEATDGPVPAAARAIMDKPAYQAARWSYQVADLETGDVLMANRAGEFAYTASTAKQFTVGTAYAVFGADSSLSTPVYATGPVQDGVLDGNLALVASGDLAMGGRNAPAGRVDSSFTATSVDHVYGDIAPNAVKPPGSPLAGLNSLAGQVADRGIERISGDVVIDTRLWQTYDGQEGPVTPIFVNDNLLDLTVTPGAAGEPAAVAASPRTDAYAVTSSVRTVAGSDAALQVSADPRDPRRLVVTGTIGASGGPHLTVYRITDAASWARTLFIEALARAGVAVTASPTAANRETNLPEQDDYRPDQRVATLRSAPIAAMGTMILKTSYNTGANALLCLLAANQGSDDCLDGLEPVREQIETAGLAANDVVLFDGQGADPASTTPAQMVNWLRWTQSQPWGAAFKAGQPVLGESGSLATAGLDSPAKGMIAAKTGTSAYGDPATGRALFNVQALSGFMTTRDGRTLVFDLAMSGGTYPDVLTGLVQAGLDVAGVAAAFQQELSR